MCFSSPSPPAAPPAPVYTPPAEKTSTYDKKAALNMRRASSANQNELGSDSLLGDKTTNSTTNSTTTLSGGNLGPGA